MRPRTPTELRLGTHAGCPSSWDQAWGRAEARLLPAGPRSNSTGGDQPGTWREGLIPASNPGLRLPESEAGASARPALPARSWNWVGRRNQGLRRGIPAALPAARGRGGPGQGDPAGGRRGAPAPSAAATSSIFPVFRAFPLGPLALPPVIGAPAPSPGFPKGGTSLSPPRPRHPQATSGPCPSAALGPGAGPRREGVYPRMGPRWTRAARPRPGVPSLPVPSPRGPAALAPTPPPAQRRLPAAPSPRRARPAWQLAPRAWGRRGERGLLGGRARGNQRGRKEGARPPPAPLLLPLLRGLPGPPPAASLLPPPSLSKTSPHGPAAAATFPAGAADVAERPGAGRPCQGSPRPVSLAPRPPPAPAPPPLAPPPPPDRGSPQPGARQPPPPR